MPCTLDKNNVTPRMSLTPAEISTSQHLLVRRLIIAIIVIMAVITTVISIPERAEAAIKFQKDCNSLENSNVRQYSEQETTNFLTDYSDKLKKAIESSKGMIEVTKGCHQPKRSHFTLKETRKGCEIDPYAGTKSTHVPC